MKKRPFHRNLSLADFHSGHLCGLTPPEFSPPPINERAEKFSKVRDDLWAFFKESLDEFRPFDSVFVNGDCIEGKGERSGGTELITSGRAEQIEIARAVIHFVKAPVVRLLFGTPAHTGKDEDWEGVLDAMMQESTIGAHEWFSINGRIFDVKHKVGSSTIPHGRLTPLAREVLWNRVWAARGEQPLADVLLRAHSHYYEHTDHDNCLAFNQPCLQGYGSKFGSRECSGTIDMGVLVFDIYTDGEIKWHKRLLHGLMQVAEAEVLA
jgi:hypothetical protein